MVAVDVAERVGLGLLPVARPDGIIPEVNFSIGVQVNLAAVISCGKPLVGENRQIFAVNFIVVCGVRRQGRRFLCPVFCEDSIVEKIDKIVVVEIRTINNSANLTKIP